MASLYNVAKHYLVSSGHYRRWVWVWLPFILGGLLPGLLAGRWLESRELVLQGCFFLLLSAVSLKKIALQYVALFILGSLVILALLGQWRAAHVWLNSERHQSLSFISSWREDKVVARSSRNWKIPEATERLELTLEAKLLSGTVGWQWYPSIKGYTLEPKNENGIIFTHVTTPIEGDPYLLRNYTLPEAIAGQTFRVEIELRSSTPLAAEGCRGIWLQTWLEGGGASCLALALTPEWQTFQHTWTAPSEAVSHIIRIILNDFDGLSYDVGTTKLYRQTATGWEELKPLLPAMPGLTSSWETNEGDGGHGFELTKEWQPYRFSFNRPPDTTSDSSRFSATLLVPQGVTLATRHVKLSVPSRPVASGVRQSYVFGHPNLAGHTVIVLTLVAMALSPGLLLQLLVSALGLSACFFTGSRTAWLVLLVGVVILLWLKQPTRRKQLVILYLGLMLALAVAWPFLGRLQITSISNPVSRQEIWLTSLRLIRDHLWLGIGALPQTFSNLWTSYNPDAAEVVTHAHNVVLEWLVNFGVLGGLAILWLIFGLLRIAWSKQGWIGITVMFAVLALNMADVSLFYTWVLVPLVLYLNTRET
jgi:O-Antigen ligase